MLEDKLEKLIDILKGIDSAVLAYSGGVDGTLLLKVIQLSGIKAIAITAVSETMPEHDLLYAKKLSKELGIEHRIIRTDELRDNNFTNNPVNRCFFCKDGLFKKIKEIADNEGFRFVLDGSNIDDMSDWRPGREAAAKYNVRSPLIEAGLCKRDIREISKNFTLPSWDRPSSPCLASRFPYGEQITIEALKQVAAAEEFLRSFGFTEFRVRHHGNMARIELKEDDMKKLFSPQVREAVTERLKILGYRFIALDLECFRSGRMNEK